MEGSHMCKTQYLQVGDYFTFEFCFDLKEPMVLLSGLLFHYSICS